jgi:positive regulator of sigma E activity
MLPRLVGFQRIDEGRIVEQKMEKILVVLNPECAEPTSCTTCGGKASCARAAKPTVCTIDISGESTIEPGTRIRVSHFIFNKTLAAFLIFGLPLVFAFLAMILQQSIAGSTGDSIWTIVAGGTGFVSGFFIAATVERVVKQLTSPPKIVSISEENTDRTYHSALFKKTKQKLNKTNQ